jgi:hypothetical protein
MKKLLIGLLALGMVFGFSMPAAAVDVSVTGSYYIIGYYADNWSLNENAVGEYYDLNQIVAGFDYGDGTFAPGSLSPTVVNEGASSAFFAQRLRVQPVFQVAEGLKLTCRFDALEKYWGKTRYDNRSLAIEAEGAFTDSYMDFDASGSFPFENSGYYGSVDDETYYSVAANAYTPIPKNEENISFERVFVTFMTPYGQVEAGIKPTNAWGLAWGNSETNVGEIDFLTKVSDKVSVLLRVEKDVEGDMGTRYADADQDGYIVAGVFADEGIQAGMLYKYVRNATNRPTKNYKALTHVLSPYVKTTVGPATVAAQLYYYTGKAVKFDEGIPASDVDVRGLSFYLEAQADVGPAYVGAAFGYAQGDDPGTTDKNEGAATGGVDFSPLLILYNDLTVKWMGDMGDAVETGDTLSNAFYYQIFAGMSPVEKLDLYATYALVKADEVAPGVDDSIGSEFDVTAAYKLYDNLQYQVGFGYFWTGDWFKGGNVSQNVDDNYLLLNKLTLSF